MRPLAGHLISVLRLRCKRYDGVDDCRRFAESLGINTNAFLPRFAVHGKGHLRSDKRVRLFAREIRRAPFRRLYFYFFAGLDLDQRFRSGPVLLVGLQPNRPPQHFGVIVDRHRCARAAAGHLPFADFVGVVQVIAARSNRNFQPAVARLIAVEQRPVRTGNICPLRLCHGIAHVISRRIERTHRLQGAFQLRLQRREQRRALRPIRRRGACRLRQARKEDQRTQIRNHATTNRYGQRVPRSQLDGTAKHSVYATGQRRTKRRARVISVHLTLIGRLFLSIRCMPGRRRPCPEYQKALAIRTRQGLSSASLPVLLISAGCWIVRRAAAFSYCSNCPSAARQPNTQTNSDSSCDDSHHPPNPKVRPRSGQA